MKRDLALVAFLCLLIILTANPSMSSIPAAIGNESQEAMFSTASDGDESSESITSFAPTLDDDVLFYPDTLHNSTINLADSGDAGPDVETYSYTDTHSMNAVAYYGTETTSGTSYVIVNFTVAQTGQLDGFGYSVYCAGQGDDDSASMWFYDWVADTWDSISSVSLGSYSWENGTNYNSDYWNSTQVSIKVSSTDADGSSSAFIDYAEITQYYLTLADSDHFGESFADISDITVSVGETVTTDDDLGTFHHPGDNAWDYYFWNDPSALAVQVIEWRCHANISSSSYEFALYSANDGGGSQLWTSGSITAPTSAATEKYSPMVTGVESIRIATRHASSPASFIFDYLRGGLSTEAGWSFDGSTTAGVSDNGQANSTFTYSSDDDILTLNVTRDAGVSAAYCYFYIALDTTATSSEVELDYYPFFAVRYKLTGDSNTHGIRLETDGMYAGSAITKDAWTTTRTNMVYMGYSGEARVWFYVHIAGGYTAQFEVEWAKAYSIANWTYSSSGVGTDDYLYTDSGVLHSHIDDGYIEMNHDPALSVSDTYSIYNLTTPSTAPEFSQYVSSWSTYSDDTRGATTSGTVTDIKLKFSSAEIISAIKFIEDGTAPAVVRSSSTPNDPSDDENVMLTAVVTDAVEVYKVYFDAIVSPAGFSDVPYYATEQTDNLWTYEFATLPTGPYVFKIVATDGANENALTEYAYVELTVREAAIIINPITFLGAGNDFEDVTMSFECNRDGSYVVREWTQSDGSDAANTWTGTVIDGWNNIAWDKLTTDSEAVYFNFTITSGSLSWVYENQYQVAQNTFYLSTASQVEGLDAVTVAGRISKLGAWQLYDENNEFKDSGSITDLDFTIRFTKWSGYDEQDHDFAIKFTNGSQSCWYNSSFYAFKKPVVAPVPTTDKNVLYAYQASFWTAIGIGAVVIMVGIDLYRRYWKK